MQPELANGRRLRFPVQPYEDESVPGAIARAMREHVLIRATPLLDAAGVSMKQLGYAQLAASDELERLAHVARCPAEDFLAKAGEPMIGSGGKKFVDVRFGRLILPRVYFEFDRRRIAPRSLRERGYHRLSWVNRLLPYCEDSLERMVSSCSACGATLSWAYSRGMDRCDACGEEIMPSLDSALPAELGEDYKLFAQLSSLHPSIMEAALEKLPPKLRSVAPGTLIRLALRIGGISQDLPVAATSQKGILGLTKLELASMTVAGAAFLKSWPSGLRSWVEEKSACLRDSPTELAAIWSRLKQLVNRYQEASDLVSIVSDALPDLQKHAAHAFSEGRRYYLYAEVQQRLGLLAPQMAALRECPDIEYIGLRASGKRQGHFDADQIDQLIPRFRNTLPFNSCASRFKVPLYAIEQFCRSGLLKWENHPAVTATQAWRSVQQEGLKDLSRRLADASRGDDPPAETATLLMAVKRLGGRLKPWSAILESLIDGSIEFWSIDDGTTIAGIYVCPGDMAIFDRLLTNMPDVGVPQSEAMSQLDAAEVLNILPYMLPQWDKALNLPFARNARALVTPMAGVLAVASRVAWNAEIAWHIGVNHRQVDKTLQDLHIPRSATGWCRHHLIAAGILPEMPG